MCYKRICSLLKRDIMLLIHCWKRILLFVCSILLIDFILVVCSQSLVFKQEILGITVRQFMEEPRRFPLHWIWQQIGIVLICIDFVKKDFCECFSCLISRIRKKSYFWVSKMATIAMLAFGLSCYMFLEKCVMMLLFHQLGMNIEISGGVLFKTVLLGFVGTCTLCWIYSFISIVCNEVVGVLGCLVYLVCGIPTHTQWLYCNCFMSIRGEVIQTIVVGGVIAVLCFMLGIIKINRMDAIGRR